MAGPVLLAGAYIHHGDYDTGWLGTVPIFHALAHSLDPLEPAGGIDNSATGVSLNGVYDVAVFHQSGATYAVAAAYDDNAVQVLDITDPSSITPVDRIFDNSDRLLRTPTSVDIFRLSGHTYAAVGAYHDDGVQILNLTDPADIVPAGKFQDTFQHKIDRVTDVKVFNMSGHTYAAAVSDIEHAVQVLNLTNPADVRHVSHIVDTGDLYLQNPRGIDIFRISGHTYAAVASHTESGVQILNFTGLPTIDPVDGIGDTGSRTLRGSQDIDVFNMSGHTYAAVASYTENGVQILNITNPADITAAGRITDSTAPSLANSYGVEVFHISHYTYAAVASENDDAIQLLNLTGLPTITAVADIRDTPDLELNGPQKVDIFTLDGRIHAAVAGTDDDGIQILGINLHATNSPPSVWAGSNTAKHEDTLVSLSGTASDPDGDPMTYLWTHDSALPITLSNATALNTTFTAPDVARSNLVTFTLNATDHHGASSSDTMQVFIYDNFRPVVDAGPDQTVSEGSIVTLDGTGTSDPNNDPMTYLWTHNSTLPITLSNAAALDPTFTAPNVTADTTILFTLNATDHHNATSTDTMRVTVINNDPPTVRVSSNQLVNEGNSMFVSALVTDPDGDPLTYLWTHNSTLPLAFKNSTALFTAVTYPRIDADTVIHFTMTATDIHGATGSSTMKFTIINDEPHSVDLGPDRAVNEGDVVILNATLTDPDNTPLLIGWTHNGTSLGITLHNPTTLSATFTAPEVDSTTYVLVTATVTESRDNPLTVADSVLVTIRDIKPLDVDAGANQAVNEGGMVILAGTAGGTPPITYEWACNGVHASTGPISIGSPNSPSVAFTAPEVTHRDQAYTCTLTATDSAGSTGSDSLRLLVREVPDADEPVLAMIGDSTPTVVLGSAWTDPGASCVTLLDGTALSYTTSGSVDTSTTGTYHITYKCVHAGGSMTHVRTVTVIQPSHDEDPKVTIIYQRGAVKSGDPDADYSGDAKCRDREDGDISHAITTHTTYYDNGGPRATITYSCTDSGGNTATASMGAAVISGNTPPTISLTGGSIHLNVGDSWSDPGATCNDAEDGTWTIKAFKNTIDTTTAGHYLMLYSCVDSHGTEHVNGGVRHVYVTNNDLPPVLTLSSYQTTISVNGTWSMPTATCIDKEDGDISSLVTTYGSNSINVHKAGTYKMTFKCEDSADNFRDEFFEVIVTE